MISIHTRNTPSIVLACLAIAGTAPLQLQAQDRNQQDSHGQSAGESTTASTTARELDLQLLLGVTHSDNMMRLPATGSDTAGELASAGMRMEYKEQTRRLRADVQLNAQYEHYLDDQFNDGVSGWLDGTLGFSLVPDRLEWVFQDNFGQTRIDPFAAVTPDNRENINFFTTGPDLNFALGSAFMGRLSGRYSTLNYELTDLGGDRYSGAVALVRETSPAGALSLNLTSERVEPEQTPDDGYDHNSVFGRYEAHGSRTELKFDLGYTQLNDRGETADGFLLNAELKRRVSPSSTVTFDAGSTFSDAGDLLRSGRGMQGTGFDTAATLGTTDPFKASFAALGWEFQRARTTLSLTLEGNKHRYENQRELDRTLTIYGATASRRLSRAFTLYAGLSNVREKFERVDARNRELHADAGVMFRLGAASQLQLEYSRIDRDSTVAASEFKENRISLYAVWSPFARAGR